MYDEASTVSMESMMASDQRVLLRMGDGVTEEEDGAYEIAMSRRMYWKA